MIDVDLRRYGQDKDYEKAVNSFLKRRDPLTLVEYGLQAAEQNGEELACYSCVYAPYAPACDNCLFDSNYIRKETKNEHITK